MASEEDINNQEQMNNAREEERDYIRESYEFLGDTLDIGAKIADQLKSIVGQVKDKTTLDKETLKRADETVKVISNLKVDYDDMSEIQKDIKKIEDQRTKNLIQIQTLSKQITQEELNHAQAAIKTEEQYSIEAKILEDNISKKEAINASIIQQESLGINVNDSLYEQLDLAEQQVDAQQSLVAGLQAEAYKYTDLAGPQAMQLALLMEANLTLEEALDYLEEEERAIKNIQKAMAYWNVSLGAVKGIMEGIGLESATVTLGLEAGQEAAEAMADRLTKGGQESLTFIGKFRVLAAGVAATTTTLFKEVGAALLAIFSVKAITKLVGSFFKPLTKFVGDLKQKVVEAFNFIRNEFLSLDSFIADYQEGERLFFDISQAIADTATNLGLSTQAAQELYDQTEGIAKSVGMLPEEFLATAEALNQTFGTTKKFSDDTMKTLAQMTKLYGLSAEEASKLTMQAELQGQTASDYNLEAMETVMVLKERYNIALSEQEVIKATANASDSFKLSVGNSAKAIADAAFQAKRLGLEMSDVEGISSNLLDFESSIAKEMEAELLLGKDLNLDKARQFALNNDISGVAREVAKQIGSAAEFTKMNRIQQDALAESIGVSRDELANMLQTQELLAGTGFDDMSKAQEEFRNLVKETGSEEKALAKMREQGATQALTDRMREISAGEKRELQERAIAEAQMKIAEAALPMVNAFLDFLKYIKEIKVIIVQEMKPFFKAFSGLIKSAGKEMKEGMVSPAASLGKTLNNVGLTLVDLGKKYLPSIVRMFTSAYSVITSIFNIVGKIVAGLAQTKDSTEDTKNIFESISNFLLKVADYINNIDVDPILKFAEGVKNIFDKVLTVIGQITKFVKDNPKLVAGGALVIGGAVAAKKTVDNLLPLGSRMRPMTVVVKNTDDFGGGGDGGGDMAENLVDKLKDKFMGGGDGDGPSAFDLAKGKGLSDKQILAGFGGKEAMEEMKSAFTDGLQDKVSNAQDDIKDRVLEGGDSGGRGGIGGGLSSIGKGIGDFGKGIGKGIEGVFKGLAKGIAAFANPAILLGATILAASITIIGAGIAGAVYIFSKVLPSLAEGMKTFEELDGKALMQAGAGMGAIGLGLVALAAGGVAATGAALAIGVLTLMGPGIFKPIEDFGKLNLDAKKIKNNAAAVGYWAAGMAALAVGSSAGAFASFAGMAGSLFDGIAGFFGGGGLPEDKMQAFAAMDLDPKKMARNSKAVAAYSLGMAALAVGSVGSTISSMANVVGNVFDGITGFFGGALPGDKMIAFQSLNLDAEKMKNNSKAVVEYSLGMAALAAGSMGSTISSMANTVGSVYDSITGFFGGALPGDKMIAFQSLNLDAEKMGNNADAVAAYTKGMAILTAGSAASTISSMANVAGSLADGIVGFFGGDLPLDKVRKFGEVKLNAEQISNNATAVVGYGEAMAALGKGDAMGFVGSLSNAGKQLVDGIVSFFGGSNELPIDKLNKFGAMKINSKGIKKNASAIVMFSEAMSGLKELNTNIATLGNVLSDKLITNLNRLNDLEVKDLNLGNLAKEMPFLAKIANIVTENRKVFVEASHSLTTGFVESLNLLSTLIIPESRDFTPLVEAAQAASNSSAVILKVNDEHDIKFLPRIINSKFIEALNSLNTIIIPTQDFTLLNKAAQEFTQGLIVLVTADKEHNIRDIDDVLEDDVVESINLLQNIKTEGLDFSTLPAASEKLSKALTIITTTPAFLVIGDYITRNLPIVLNRVNQINFDKVNFEAMDQMSDKLPRLVDAYSKFGNLDIKKLQTATKTISDLTESLPKESFVDQVIGGIEAIPSMLGNLFKEGVDGVLEIASPEELNEVKSSFGLEATNTQNGNEDLKQELQAIKTLLEKVTTRPIELDSTVTVELDGNKVGQALAQNNYRVQ